MRRVARAWAVAVAVAVALGLGTREPPPPRSPPPAAQVLRVVASPGLLGLEASEEQSGVLRVSGAIADDPAPDAKRFPHQTFWVFVERPSALRPQDPVSVEVAQSQHLHGLSIDGQLLIKDGVAQPAVALSAQDLDVPGDPQMLLIPVQVERDNPPPDLPRDGPGVEVGPDGQQAGRFSVRLRITVPPPSAAPAPAPQAAGLEDAARVPRQAVPHDYREGDKVFVRSMGQRGTVTSVKHRVILVLLDDGKSVGVSQEMADAQLRPDGKKALTTPLPFREREGLSPRPPRSLPGRKVVVPTDHHVSVVVTPETILEPGGLLLRPANLDNSGVVPPRRWFFVQVVEGGIINPGMSSAMERRDLIGRWRYVPPDALEAFRALARWVPEPSGAEERVLYDYTVPIEPPLDQDNAPKASASDIVDRILNDLERDGYLRSENLPVGGTTRGVLQAFLLETIANAADAVGQQWQEPSVDAEIRLRAVIRDAMLWLQIQDNGPGFPPEILRKVGREPVTTTREAPDPSGRSLSGRGQHLYTVSALAQQLEWHLVIENRSAGGQVTGANVSLGIPLPPSAATPAARPERPEEVERAGLEEAPSGWGRASVDRWQVLGGRVGRELLAALVQESPDFRIAALDRPYWEQPGRGVRTIPVRQAYHRVNDAPALHLVLVTPGGHVGLLHNNNVPIGEYAWAQKHLYSRAAEELTDDLRRLVGLSAAGLEESQRQAVQALRDATGLLFDVADGFVRAARAAPPELLGNPSGSLPGLVWSQAQWIPDDGSVYIPLKDEPTGVWIRAVEDPQGTWYVVERSGDTPEERARLAAFQRAAQALVAATGLPVDDAGALLGLLIEQWVLAPVTPNPPIPLFDAMGRPWNIQLVLEQVDWAGAAIVPTPSLPGDLQPGSSQTLWLPLKEAQRRQPGELVVTRIVQNVVHKASVPYALLIGWGDYGLDFELELPPVAIHDAAAFADYRAAVQKAVEEFRNRPDSHEASGLEERKVEGAAGPAAGLEEVREFNSVDEFIGTVTAHEAMQKYLDVWAEGALGSRRKAVRILDLPRAAVPAGAPTTVTIYTDTDAIQNPAVQDLVTGWSQAGAPHDVHFTLQRYPGEGQPITTPAFGVRPVAAGPYANLPTLTYKRLDDLRAPGIAALYAIAVNAQVLAGQAIPIIAALDYYDDVLEQRRTAIFV